MDESEDNMSAVDGIKTEFASNIKKPKKRSLVERELETNLTARVTSPVTTGGGVTLSRYGRARRSKHDSESTDSKKIVLEVLKSPLSEKSPVKVASPVYKMHASNSPIRSESPKKVMVEETYLDNQIESIYQENISLSRFGAEEIVTSSPAKKIPKVYIRKDLIQKRDQDETILLIKNIFSPVKSTSKSTNSHLSNVLERSSERFSLKSSKIQNGYLDNSSVVKTLDFDGNKKKKKENKDNKVMSKSDIFDIEAKCPFQVGDLAWARMGTYPFWPCIVTRDPCTGMFVKTKLFGRVEHDILHVTFFGDNGRRGWIVDNMLRKFLGQLEFEATRDKFTPEDKKKDPRLYAAFYVSDKKIPMWNTSVEEAEMLLREPKRLRIDILNDMLQTPKALKTTPKQPKSGKITRTDSDVSLSESLYDSLFSEDDGKIEDTDRSRNKTRNKSFDVSQVVTACLDNMAAKTGITRIQRQSHMDRWLQKAKSKTPEKAQVKNPVSQSVEKESKTRNNKKKKRISPTQPVQKPYRLRKSHNESHNNLYAFNNEHDYSTYQNEENNAAVTNEIDLTNEDSDRYNNYAPVEPGSGIGIIVKVETLCEKPEINEQDDDVITTIVSEDFIVSEPDKPYKDVAEITNTDKNTDLSKKHRQETIEEPKQNYDVVMEVDTPIDFFPAKPEKEAEKVAKNTENNNISKQKKSEDVDNDKIMNGDNILDSENSYVQNDAIAKLSDIVNDSDENKIQDKSDDFKNMTSGVTVADSKDQDLNNIETDTNVAGTKNINHDNIHKNQENSAIENKIQDKSDDFKNMTYGVTVADSKDQELNDIETDTNVVGTKNINHDNIHKNQENSAIENKIQDKSDDFKNMTYGVTVADSKDQELNEIETDTYVAGTKNISHDNMHKNQENSAIVSNEALQDNISNVNDNIATENPLDVNINVKDNFLNANNKSVVSEILTTDVSMTESKGEELSVNKTDINMAGPNNMSLEQNDIEKSTENTDDISIPQNNVIGIIENENYSEKTLDINKADDSVTQLKKIETKVTQESNDFLYRTEKINDNDSEKITVKNDLSSKQENMDSVCMEPREDVDSLLQDSIDSPFSEVLPYSPLSNCDKLDQDDIGNQLIDQLGEQDDEINETNEKDDVPAKTNFTNSILKDQAANDVTCVESERECESPIKKKTSIDYDSQTVHVNGFHDEAYITNTGINKFDEETVTPKSEDSQISTNKLKVDTNKSINKIKYNSKPENKSDKSLQDPKFLKYLQLRQDSVMDEHPELNEDEISAYLFKTWLYEENTKSDAKKADEIQQSGLVKGLEKNRRHKTLSITLQRIDTGYSIKKKVKDDTDTASISSENSEISVKRITRSRRIHSPYDELKENIKKQDIARKMSNELISETVSIDSKDSEYSMSKRFGSNYSPLESAKDDRNEDIVSVSSQDIGTPLSKRRRRCRRLNSTIEEDLISNGIPDKNDGINDADTASINSEESETPLTKWLKSSKKPDSSFKVGKDHKSIDNDRDAEIVSINSEDFEIVSLDKFHSPSDLAKESGSNKVPRKSQDDRDEEVVSLNSEDSDTFFTVSKRRYKRIKFPAHIVAENKALEVSIKGNTNNNRVDIEKISISTESNELKTTLPLSKLVDSEDLEDFDIPLSKRILRPKVHKEPLIKTRYNDKAESPEKRVIVKKEPDTVSINSEDSDMPLSRRRERSKNDKKTGDNLDDPDFVKYLELRQDALIDENPHLTQDDIVGYLYKTWLYEENAKSDMKKTDDIEQSNLVKGLNQDVNQPKKIRKKVKVEKEIYDNDRQIEKPKRKIVKPYYNEDFSDIEDELEMFEIFKKKGGSVPKPIVLPVNDVKVKEEKIEIKENLEVKENSEIKESAEIKVKGEIHETIEINDDQYEVEDEIDVVEAYFNDLVKPKPNVFKGLLREKVCEICEKVGNLVKCKGCNGMFHIDCVNKVVEVVQTPIPSRGRKKKKKTGRKHKGSEDDSQSEDKTQDISDEHNISIEEIIDPEVCTVDAEKFEAQLTVKMKEILGDIDTIHYDSYSSDDGLDWSDTVAGKCEIVDVKLKPKQNTEFSDFKCNNCQQYNQPTCFVCKLLVSKNLVEHRQRCQVAHCHKYYHLECLDHWPQTQFNGGEPSRNNKKINEHFEAVTCPRHVCHTCVSDDPRGCKTRFSGDKLARCVRCPATYHSFTKCLPAGTQILTGSHIICPRHYEHRPGKVPCHVNTGWCFICALGGTLICCEYCPTSFHAECLNIKPPEGGYMCEDCETGRLPLYGEMVWVKLGHYRWWPGIILNPCEIPDNIMAVKHGLGEFVVRFFGQYDHYWVNRGRVFPFQEGDSGRISSQKSKIDADFTTAMEHAQRAFEILKTAQPNEEESLDIASSLLPPHYVKLKVNKPCGSVLNRRPEDPESSLTQCDCDPTPVQGSEYDEPCGPYSHCLNRMLLTECGPTCRAGDRCSNRAFEKRQYPKLVPYRTPHRGWGLKTLEDIKAGQFVIEYVGEVVDEAEFQRRMRRKHEMRDENYYFLTLDKERMIDAGPKGNLARFMNHCCEPNCETQKWTVLGDVRVGLFALYDIPANSEVTFNYNLECAGIDKKRCLCGARRCSGYMGAKPKQDESQPKKSKVAAKRTYKKRKNVEDSPSTSKNKPAKRLGRPPKPKELTEIEKDLLIIRNATNGVSSDETRLSSTDSDKNAKALKRKRVSFSTDEVNDNLESPSTKKQKLDDVGD